MTDATRLISSLKPPWPTDAANDEPGRPARLLLAAGERDGERDVLVLRAERARLGALGAGSLIILNFGHVICKKLRARARRTLSIYLFAYLVVLLHVSGATVFCVRVPTWACFFRKFLLAATNPCFNSVRRREKKPYLIYWP